MNFHFTMLAFSALALSPPPAAAESVEAFLRAFHQNPARVMRRLPPFVDAFGNTISRGDIKEGSLDWAARIAERDLGRAALIGSSLKAAPSEGQDRPDLVVDPGPMLRDLGAMQAQGLTQVTLTPVPWTDSYWPLLKGNLGQRYADASFPDSKDWSVNHNYVTANSAAAIVASGNQTEIDKLSPSEKYDFAVGDTSWGLTGWSWRQGGAIFDRSGRVPGWMGICHGWAAAAHMLVPVPRTPTVVTAANGGSVTFYPQDVRALQSMLWANAAPAVRFAGNRCTVASPARNANGRVIDRGCFDVSPSTWHLGLVNQAGLRRRSLILDATYDQEVWNHPVVSYRYRYFHPQSWKESSTVSAATVPYGEFRTDKFREFRSPSTRFVVGIYMDVTYVVEINPGRVPYEPRPPVKTLRLIYDLELDADRNVIGGEWYSNAHPDFLWTVPVGASAQTREDPVVRGDPWAPGVPVPSAWSQPAARASSRGAPLATFVNRLSQ